MTSGYQRSTNPARVEELEAGRDEWKRTATQWRDRAESLQKQLDDAAPAVGMVRTRHGWARPCAACGSTNFSQPCREAEDGFHK